jgi:chromosome segregation protein
VFVTREGDTVDSSGRMSGGSTRALAGGLLARKAELQKLQESITALSAEHGTIQGRMHDVEVSLAEWRERSERLGHDSHDADIQASTVDKEWSSVTEQATRLKREVESEREERATIEAERAELWAKLDGIRVELKALEEASRSRQGDIDGKTAAFNAAMNRCAELQAALIQVKVDATSAREKYGFSQERREALRKEIDSFAARFDEINRVLNNKLDEKDGLQSELMELEESLQSRIDDVQAKEDETRSARDGYERARRSLTELMTLQKELMKTVEESSSELNKQRLESDRGVMEYQTLLQGLFERYALEESSIAHDPAFDEISPAREKAMMEDVESLREKIRRLGEVNVLAVDEYDEQKKRCEFLCSQRDDLLRSIADLEKAIERINKTSEERFVRAFHEINKRFQQIFPLVFGGGSASLELTNPEDMAETGVEIMAEPPGKKVGSIQLLSGGEKALTAVALIFSIFLIKPSPFCVLDEVDAPLDDHNVGKFNMLLKEMAARSQFIIITHNKRTMELNNKLYGVTMEEPGVSKMVSIEMR